jgi:hypothetical protein
VLGVSILPISRIFIIVSTVWSFFSPFHYILCIFQDIVEHWLITENVDGFYIRNSAYMYEDYDMRNETKSNIPGTNEVLYFYTPFAPSLVFCMVFCGLFSFLGIQVFRSTNYLPCH